MKPPDRRAGDRRDPGSPPVDRRRQPDRRAGWRGGRRDADWVNRPVDADATAPPVPAGNRGRLRWLLEWIRG